MGVSPSVFVSPVCLPSALTRERRKSRLISAALHKGSLSPPAFAPASASGYSARLDLIPALFSLPLINHGSC